MRTKELLKQSLTHLRVHQTTTCPSKCGTCPLCELIKNIESELKEKPYIKEYCKCRNSQLALRGDEILTVFCRKCNLEWRESGADKQQESK